MARQELRRSPALALAGDSAEHIHEIARVITGVSHDACSEHVGLRLIFAAVFCHPRLCAKHTELRASLAAEDRAAEDQADGSQLIFPASLFCRLRSCVAKGDVRDL